MTAYKYDEGTGEYLAPVECQPSPLEPGSFLQPRGSTFEAPPESGEKRGVRWVGNRWLIVPDFRDTPLWYKSGESKGLPAPRAGFGEDIPSDCTDLEPPKYPAVFANGAWQKDEAAAAEQALQKCLSQRQGAYMMESDPLFFGFQRGENTKDEWLAKITEIKARFPKPGL